jgi:predicted RNase H-like HicB family nuclease
MRYPVVIHKDRDSDFGVIVPDLPGCFSAGENMEAAMANAAEAIECHLECLLMDGGDIPAARSVEAHLQNPDYAGDIWALVSVDLLKLATSSKRINITLPERVLTLADEQAEREGETRSNLLTRALMEYIARHKT